jgi:hypothetical protein
MSSVYRMSEGWERIWSSNVIRNFISIETIQWNWFTISKCYKNSIWSQFWSKKRFVFDSFLLCIISNKQIISKYFFLILNQKWFSLLHIELNNWWVFCPNLEKENNEINIRKFHLSKNYIEMRVMISITLFKIFHFEILLFRDLFFIFIYYKKIHELNSRLKRMIF